MMKKLKSIITFVLAYLIFLLFGIILQVTKLLDLGNDLNKHALTDENGCPDVEYSTLQTIAKTYHSSDPSAFITIKRSFSLGKACIGALVYVPIDYIKNELNGIPLNGYPPDSLYLEIIGTNYQVVPKTALSYSLFNMSDGSVFRYYNIDAYFRDSDTYHVTGYLEYVNYKWNFERKEDVVWNPFPLKFFTNTEAELDYSDSMEIVVEGHKLSYDRYNQLPYCLNGNASGRWVKTELITADVSSFPADSMTSFKDSNGMMWLPFDCKYRFLSHSQFLSFLSENQMHLHVYGDSNMRRSLKVITTSGSFCRTMYASYLMDCQCTDKKLIVPFYNNSESINYFPQIAGYNNTSIYFHDQKGLISWKGVDFDAEIQRSRLESIMMNLGIKDRRIPDAVIIGLVNWDVGYDTFSKFREKLPKFISSLKNTYDGIPIIWRPGQFYCCRVDKSKRHRKYSRLRFEAFNDFALKELSRQLPNQLYIWDVWSMGAAHFPESKSNISSCDSNHMSRLGIDLENQILFNMLMALKTR